MMSDLRSIHCLILVSGLAFAAAQGEHTGPLRFQTIFGKDGKSCNEACETSGGICAENRPYPPLENIEFWFKKDGVNCRFDGRLRDAAFQPAVVTDFRDPRFGMCVGLRGAEFQECAPSSLSVRRVCMCQFEG